MKQWLSPIEASPQRGQVKAETITTGIENLNEYTSPGEASKSQARMVPATSGCFDGFPNDSGGILGVIECADGPANGQTYCG